jgi:hypothetical protein
LVLGLFYLFLKGGLAGGSRQLAVGSMKVAGGSRQYAVGSWQSAVIPTKNIIDFN